MRRVVTTIENAISLGREGLIHLFSDTYFRNLVRRYPLTEIARERLSGISFRDKEPYFILKDCDWLTIHPAEELGGRLLRVVKDEEHVKWFLLLYCVSSASDLFKHRILRYLDKELATAWSSDEYSHSRYYDLRNVSNEIRYCLVDGILDVDEVIRHSFPSFGKIGNNSISIREDRSLRQAVSQFLLSAGFHYISDPNIVPAELLGRDAGLPFSLSSAMYISVMTGKDFDDSLAQVLHENGAEGRLDDILAMVRKNTAIEELENRNESLRSQIAANDEEIRKQETAGDIISTYIGAEGTKDVIEARVAKCNAPEYRVLLYKLESLTGGKLSVLTRLESTSLSKDDIEQFVSSHGVMLSPSEHLRIVTIEDLIDTILRHNEFIEKFKQSVLYDRPLGPISEGDPYDLETRIKEVETVFSMSVNREEVTSLDKLPGYVSENNTVLMIIVETIVEQLGVEKEEVKLESSLTNDLGADSLDFVELLMTAEKQYGIRIPDEEAGRIATVKDMYNVVIRHLHDKSQ